LKTRSGVSKTRGYSKTESRASWKTLQEKESSRRAVIPRAAGYIKTESAPSFHSLVAIRREQKGLTELRADVHYDLAMIVNSVCDARERKKRRRDKLA
jgi:hypothetical protein